jgi:membrane protein implicated in regulation of membrane protease activity
MTALLYILSIFPGIVLLLLSALVLIGLFQALMTNQQIQLQFIVIILLLSILWFIYMHLPSFIKRTLRSLWKTKKDRSDR